MKDIKKVIWGAVLLAVGVILILNALELTNIDVLFPGWWTLFIIIPCGVGIFTERDKTGNLVGLGIGVMLLLSSLDIIDFSIIWKIGVPAILIIIAIKLITNGAGRKERHETSDNVVIVTGDTAGTAIFGGKDMNFDGQVFDGAELTAIFGGVDCDLSGAIIERDCTVKATAIFGGVELIMPKGVNVKVNSVSIFGGTDDLCDKTPDAPVTIYVETVSIFGGVDIKN